MEALLSPPVGWRDRRYVRRGGRIERGLSPFSFRTGTQMNWFKHNLTALFVVNLFFVCFGIEAHDGEAKISKIVVSLAPSVTETRFALVLGDRVDCVTNYCDYPRVVWRFPKIGDFISTSIET